jgi:hypothetical protein
MDAIFKNSDVPPAGIIDKIASSGLLTFPSNEEEVSSFIFFFFSFFS